jgi:hypothetical protein
MPRAILLLGFRSRRCHRWRRTTDLNLRPGSPCGWLGLGVARAALRRCALLDRNKLDAQPAAEGSANHLQCADTFTGDPPTVDAVQHRANSTRLDCGGLYGKDLDDWLRAEREQSRTTSSRAPTTRIVEAERYFSRLAIEPQSLASGPAHNLVPPRAKGHMNFLRRTYERGATRST